MKSVVGVFKSGRAASRAAGELRAAGVADDRISTILPGDAGRELSDVPVDEGERPGIGATLGGVVGAASGASLGMAAAGFLVPGVGPVIASGIAAAALLGVGGAKVGDAMEDTLSEGLPKDDVFLVEEALRSGRSVVVVIVDGDEDETAARRGLDAAGADGLDAMREEWWLGLRDAEARDYGTTGRDFSADERPYRCGFLSACEPRNRGKAYEESLDSLRRAYPDVYGEESFRRGYERGRTYAERAGEKKAA
jgi:hypothetical protein